MASSSKRILAALLSPQKVSPKTFSVVDPAEKSASLTISSGPYDAGLGLTVTGNSLADTNFHLTVLDQPLIGGVIYWETVINESSYLNPTHSFNVGVIALDPSGGPNWVSVHGVDSATSFGALAESPLLSACGCNNLGQLWANGANVGNILPPAPPPNVIQGTNVICHLFDSTTGLYQVRYQDGPWTFVCIFDVSGTKIFKPACLIQDNFSMPFSSITFLSGNANFYYEVPSNARAGVYKYTQTQVDMFLSSHALSYTADGLLSTVRSDARIDTSADVIITREGSCWVQGGQTQGSRGQLVININDGIGPGTSDDWTTYVWRDAPVTLYAVTELAGGAYDIQQWTKAIVEDFSNDDKTLTLTLTDYLSSLDRAIQRALYPDTTANPQLANTPKPFIIGKPMYISGLAVSIADTGIDAFKYDLGDYFDPDLYGAVFIDQLYDKGNIFAWPTDYSVLQTGFQLANKPDGKVVANAYQQDGNGSLYAAIANLLTTRAGVLTANINLSNGNGGLGQFTTLGVDPGVLPFEYIVADYITQPTTYIEQLRKFMDCVCGYTYTARDGRISFGRFELPKGQPDLILTKDEIIGTPKHDMDKVPNLTNSISGKRNYTVHSPTDLSTTITEALKAELTSDYLITRSSDADLSTTGLGSQIVQAAAAKSFKTLLQESQAIQYECNRVVNMWLAPAGLWTLSAELEPSVADTIEVGQTIRVVFPRFNLKDGVNMIVKRVTSYFFDKKIDLILWAPNESLTFAPAPFNVTQTTAAPYTLQEMAQNTAMIQFTMSGGALPYPPMQIVSGTLPAGITTNIFGSVATIGGTPEPNTAGTYHVSALIQDASVNSFLFPLTITITANGLTSILSEDGLSIVDEFGTYIVQD